MNDTFNVKRFALLMRKTIYERPIQLLGVTALALSATLIIYAAALYLTNEMVAQNMSFVWGYAGGGCFLASVMFAYFTTNAAGSAYLTLPASALEKWLCGILIVGVIFTAIFFPFYRLIDYSFVTIYRNGLNKNDPHYHELYNMVRIYTFDNNLVWQAIFIFSNTAGALMLGSLYFNKVSGIKTILVYIGFIGFIFLLNYIIARLMFDNVDGAQPFSGVFIKIGNDIGILDMPRTARKIAGAAFQYALPAILWITIYIRLREKEI